MKLGMNIRNWGPTATPDFLRACAEAADRSTWKRPRTRRRHLLALGISRDEVKLATRSRKGYWRMAGNSIVQRALTKQWLWNQGVPNMRQQWIRLHYGASAP